MNSSCDKFELAGERAGDITAQVYDAYFVRCPGSRELMLLTDQHMRGRMLESVLLLLMDGSVQEQRNYIHFETKSHLSYGVLPHMYENLLGAVRDTVRASLGAEWTPAMEAAWATRLDGILTEIHARRLRRRVSLHVADGLGPIPVDAARRMCSKNLPLPPLTSESSITVPGCPSVSKYAKRPCSPPIRPS